MARVRKYINKDVLTASRERIEHIYDLFDSVVLMWSGGKDSGCCLQLLKEFHQANNLGPVECVFRDGESLPFSSIEVLEWGLEQDWINLRWQCFPQVDDRLVLGKFKNHIRWDPDREWTRPMPECAETLESLGLAWDSLLPPKNMDKDEITVAKYKGNVAFITGIRASESLVRYRSVVNKLNENYINKIEGNPSSRIRMVKPIYDWEENDVLKYLMDTEMPIASMYQGQELVGSPLRVGPPLGQASKRIGWLREIEPEFYQSIIDTFPDMEIQDRYWNEFDREKLMNKYDDGFKGVMRYIMENVDPGPFRDKLVKRYRMYIAMNKNRPEQFPPEHLLKVTMNGATERKVRGTDPEAGKNNVKAK